MSVYNGAQYLEQAITSVLNQTFQAFEMLVVDDQSDDTTPDILNAFASADPRVKVLKAPIRQGLTLNLNLALKHAQGDYIARMDSDDISCPERFEKQADFLKAHPHISVVGSFFDKIDALGQTISTQDSLPGDDQTIRQWLRSGENPLCHGAVLMRKSLLENLNGYREVFRTTQDFDLWLRIPEEVHMANLPWVLYQHRRHDQSVSRQKFLQQKQMKYLALKLYQERQQDSENRDSLMRCASQEACTTIVQDFMSADLRLRKKEYSDLLARAGRHLLEKRRYSEALPLLTASIQLNPVQFKLYGHWVNAWTSLRATDA